MIHFDPFVQNNFPNDVRTKLYQAELDLPRLILLFRGRRSFGGASVCTEIDCLVSRGSQAGVCMFDNVMPARTSDSLVRIH